MVGEAPIIMETGSPKRKVMTRSFAAYFVAYMDNDLTTSAAAISYFAILVLFPTLLLLLAIGNQIMGSEAVEKYVVGQVLAFLPGAQGFVRKNLDSIAAISGQLTVSCMLIMLWAASWLFTVIEKALNRIYGTYPRSFLHGRLVNLALMTLIFALLGASSIIRGGVWGPGNGPENTAGSWADGDSAIGIRLAYGLHYRKRSHNDHAVYAALQDPSQH